MKQKKVTEKEFRILKKRAKKLINDEIRRYFTIDLDVFNPCLNYSHGPEMEIQDRIKELRLAYNPKEKIVAVYDKHVDQFFDINHKPVSDKGNFVIDDVEIVIKRINEELDNIKYGTNKKEISNYIF